MTVKACSNNTIISRGFTLIEIMVVLVIIGIGAGLISLSMGDATKPYETKSVARELYGAMNIALEDAIFLNQQIGLRFDMANDASEFAYSYQWLFYDQQKKRWLPLKSSEFPASKVLPDYIQLELEVDGEKITLGSKEGKHDVLQSSTIVKDDEATTNTKKTPVLNPDLYFLSSGEVQNFKISIADKSTPENSYEISGDALGQLTFKRPDEKE